jgi:hypothetical protein
MLKYLPLRYHADAQAMREKMMTTVFFYAVANRHNEKWKRRMYAILYSASLLKVAEIR